MVLWELTLATAYFLGLKRTYRLALRIQKKVLLSRPGIRDFAKRRTRAVFRVALTAVETIQKRDIEIGRSVGNFLLRFLDRMKPSAHIRGDGPHMPGGSAGGVHSNHSSVPGGCTGATGTVSKHIAGETEGTSASVARHAGGATAAGQHASGSSASNGNNGSSSSGSISSSSSRSFSTMFGLGGSSSRSSSSPVSRCVGDQRHFDTQTFSSSRKLSLFPQHLQASAHLRSFTSLPGHVLQSIEHQTQQARLPAALQARDSLPTMPHYLQSPFFQKTLFLSQHTPAVVTPAVVTPAAFSCMPRIVQPLLASPPR